MIDIHCHLLYGADDGSKNFVESKKMLREAKRQGIFAVILTPHYRHGMFPYDVDLIERHYLRIREYASEIGIRTYLGTEYHMDSHCVEYIKNGRCHSLADSPYILCEYSHQTEFSYIKYMTQELLFSGYQSVIAHAERYDCLSYNQDRIRELQNLGVLIQINADSVLGFGGLRNRRFCKYVLNHHLADVIASDCHGMENRPCRMAQCQSYVSKKYGKPYADRLFKFTPGKIIEKSGE